jgi:hypothetical protein
MSNRDFQKNFAIVKDLGFSSKKKNQDAFLNDRLIAIIPAKTFKQQDSNAGNELNQKLQNTYNNFKNKLKKSEENGTNEKLQQIYNNFKNKNNENNNIEDINEKIQDNAKFIKRKELELENEDEDIVVSTKELPPPDLTEPINFMGMLLPSSAALQWDIPNFNGGSNITGYVVEWSVDLNTWNEESVGNVLSVILTGIPNVVQVYFRVKATTENVPEGGPYSVIISPTPLPPLSEPLNLQATMIILGTELQWEEPLENGGTPITGYIIEWSEDGNIFLNTVSVGNVLNTTLNGIPNNVQLFFRIKATTNDNPQGGPYSQIIQPIYPINFDISWTTCNLVVTAFNAGDPIGQNEFDIPRINTFRSDGTNIIYMSAGNVVFDPVTEQFFTPWGDRSSGSESITIPITSSLFAGVEVFASTSFTPKLTPDISQWTQAPSQIGEIKYQYSVDITGNLNQFVHVDLCPPLSEPLNLQGTMIPSGAELTWEPPTNLGGSDITGYVVEWSLDLNTWNDEVIGNVLAITITGLPNTVQVYFRVKAITSDVPEGGPYSAIIAPTPLPPLSEPINLQGSVTLDTADIEWDEPINTGGLPITGYVVEWSDDETNWNAITIGNVLNATINNLPFNTQLYFRVKAITDDNPQGGPYSLILAPPFAPPLSEPLNLEGNVIPYAAELEWDAPTEDGGTPILGYIVEWSLDLNIWNIENVGNVLSTTVTGLPNTVQVYFRVKAFTDIATLPNGGPYSITIAPTPLPPLSEPINFQGNMIPSGAELQWEEPIDNGGTPVTGYIVEWSQDEITWNVTQLGNVLATTISGLPNSIQLYFRVKAITNDNPTGGPYSITLTPIPLFPPSSPQTLDAEQDDRKLKLNWQEPVTDGGSTILGYQVEISQDGNTWSLSTTLGNVLTGFTAENLINGTSYFVRIRAFNIIGFGSYSNVTGPHVPDLRLEITLNSVQGFLENPEYIEIYNPHSYVGRLDGWFFVSHESPPDCLLGVPPQQFNFPSNATIPPFGTVRVYSGSAASPSVPFFWTNSFRWENNGDIADLYDFSGRWMSNLVTGQCLEIINAYQIAFSAGAGRTVQQIPVYPDLQTYNDRGIFPTNWVRNTGFTDGLEALAGWRMVEVLPSSSSTLQQAINNNRTIDFSITNTGTQEYEIVSIADGIGDGRFRVGRRANGPTRLALVYNYDNNWSNYNVIFDRDIPESTTFNIITDILIGFDEFKPILGSNETIYFRFVPYAPNGLTANRDFSIVGSAASPSIIEVRVRTPFFIQ